MDIYRLSKSAHSEKFVFKGALLFLVWEPDYQRRSTKDIDLLGLTENSLDNLESIAKEICKTEVEADGITFDSKNIEANLQELKLVDAELAGLEVEMKKHLKALGIGD